MSDTQEPNERIEFQGWEWGDPPPAFHHLWEQANENGAQVAMEQLTTEKAFCVVRNADPNDLEIEVMWGPFSFTFRPVKPETDDAPHAFAKVTLEKDWS